MNYKPMLVNRVVRTFSTSTQLFKSHYDELEITPKATQSEIKEAYYKLSKIHHPDKSNDEQSAKKFRSLTEAYEVLGNVNLKKMYDRGLIAGSGPNSRMEYQYEPEPTDPSLKFHKSRMNRHIIPTMDGKTPIYNFDDWSKNHYGDVFKRAKYEKDFVRNKHHKTDSGNSVRQETLMYLMFLIGGLFAILVTHGTTDFDIDSTPKHKDVHNEHNTKE